MFFYFQNILNLEINVYTLLSLLIFSFFNFVFEPLFLKMCVCVCERERIVLHWPEYYIVKYVKTTFRIKNESFLNLLINLNEFCFCLLYFAYILFNYLS